MNTYSKPFVLAAVAASLAILPACSVAEDDAATDPTATEDQSQKTVASALGDMSDMASLNAAISAAELGSIFDGPSSYTVLAPNDQAFEALGESRDGLLDEAQRPLLAGILRNHMLPGHLTPEDIGSAIDGQDGDVTMTTLGDGTVTFARDGDAITVTNATGSVARLASSATAATNGVVIPLDAVLVPGE